MGVPERLRDDPHLCCHGEDGSVLEGQDWVSNGKKKKKRKKGSCQSSTTSLWPVKVLHSLRDVYLISGIEPVCDWDIQKIC